MEDSPTPKSSLKFIALGAATGVTYGLAVRYGAQVFPDSSVFAVMTLSFMLFLPLAMGFLTIFVIERRCPQPVWMWFFFPWVTIAGAEVGMMIAWWEGTICIVMFAPIAMVASTLGGVAAGLIMRYTRSRRSKRVTLVCVLFLPMLLRPIEPYLLARRELRQFENVIEIQAPPAVVWRNIERVPRIATSELQPSWSHSIGFPDPVEATLSAEGIGGIRHATFQGGVLFIETIDVWDPERRLGFSIRAQADQIPSSTFDEHVTVGGKYFDVLHGEYILEPLANGRTRLHLISRSRVSTDFNWYAHLWTDAVMSDLQRRILFVVKNRAELPKGLSVSP